ncbi:hypothetical protein [Kitasatospora sp. NPDC004289]
MNSTGAGTGHHTDHFEQRLFEELTALASEPRPASPAPRRVLPRVRPVPAIAVGLAATVAAVALPAVLAGESGGAGAAYAVSRGDDGSIAVEVHDLSAIDAVAAELRRLGVPAAAVRASADCPLPFPEGPAARSVRAFPQDTSATVRIDPSQVPSGSTLLVIGQREEPGAGAEVVSVTTRVTGAVPACVPVHGGVRPVEPVR